MLMGAAILGIALYHAPLALHNPWVKLLHDVLYCGVDVFLFLSGLGACHSIARRGGKDYLKRRVLRIMPGLAPVLIVWSVVMLFLGALDGRSFLGSITLLGWWLGDPRQLNWYFSAVWMFFLLAVPAYAMYRRSRFPALVWLGAVVISVALTLVCPLEHLMTALTRLPVFFTGMLFGVLEQRDFQRVALLRGIAAGAGMIGVGLVFYTFWGGGQAFGQSLGLWWYPFALTTPAWVLLASYLTALVKRFRLGQLLLLPLEKLGESSVEILMVQVGVYKLLGYLGTYRNRVWIVILLVCLVAGCLYRRLVTAPLTEKRKKTCKRY